MRIITARLDHLLSAATTRTNADARCDLLYFVLKSVRNTSIERSNRFAIIAYDIRHAVCKRFAI